MKALVTGGAGFIGSHIAQALVAGGHEVRILDDLSGGSLENVPDDAEVLVGDVADEPVVRKAVNGMEVVFHHAAHRAVLRSVHDPLATDRANTHGTLAVLKAALDAGTRRVVYASSSSVYGGAEQLPTPETAPLAPRSPYAVTKLAGEHYTRVFAELFGLETISFRYFNVFGPRQAPDSAYAAVVPLFIHALRHHNSPTIHGDGRQSRSFTYVDDVVAANLAAARAPAAVCVGQAYNLASDRSYSVLELLTILQRVMDMRSSPEFAEPRSGDIRHSHADVSAATRDLGFRPRVDLEEGLRRTVAWMCQG